MKSKYNSFIKTAYSIATAGLVFCSGCGTTYLSKQKDALKDALSGAEPKLESFETTEIIDYPAVNPLNGERPVEKSASVNTNATNVGLMYSVGINAGNGGVVADASIQYKTKDLGAKLGYEQGKSGQAVLGAGAFDLSPLELDLIVAGYAGSNHKGFSAEVRKSLRERKTSDLSVGLGGYSFDFDGEGASGLNANIEYAKILNAKSKRPITWRTGMDYFSDGVLADGNFTIRTGLSIPLSGMTPAQAEQDMRNYLRTHNVSVMNSDLLKGKSDAGDDNVIGSEEIITSDKDDGYNGGTTPVTPPVIIPDDPEPGPGPDPVILTPPQETDGTGVSTGY